MTSRRWRQYRARHLAPDGGAAIAAARTRKKSNRAGGNNHSRKAAARDFEDCSFDISFSSSAAVWESEENYLITIHGDILCTDLGDEEHLAGKLRLYFADLDDAADDGIGHFDILDMQSATAPFYEALFDLKSGEVKSGVLRAAGEDIYSHNLLILDRLEILPQYRGGRLGLACLYRCIQQHWHGAGLVALKCFPLQFEGGKERQPDEWREKLKLSEFGQNQKHCRSKLQDYYRALGFESIGRTEFMVLNPYYRRSGFEELGFS